MVVVVVSELVLVLVLVSAGAGEDSVFLTVVLFSTTGLAGLAPFPPLVPSSPFGG